MKIVKTKVKKMIDYAKQNIKDESDLQDTVCIFCSFLNINDNVLD